MKKMNARIKENITVIDQINAIESIVNSYFTENKEGGTEYTPYFFEIAKVNAIALYFIEGVTFEKGEILYDCITSDTELSELVINFSAEQVMNYVLNNVAEIVEFKKATIIHSTGLVEKISDFCDVITGALTNFSKLQLGNLSAEDIKLGTELVKEISGKDINVDTIAEVIKSSVGFNMDEVTSEIIDAKNEEIVKLKTENKKAKHNITAMTNYNKKEKAKNVMADIKRKE